MQLSKDSIGYILSNAFLFSDKAQKLRNAILKDGRLAKIVNFEQFLVFKDASIISGVFIFNKDHNEIALVEIIINRNITHHDNYLLPYLYIAKTPVQGHD
jgi:hypothetical protein